jgi:hypothetical protein
MLRMGADHSGSAPLGVKARNTRAGSFWNYHSGSFISPNGPLLRTNKKENRSGDWSYSATQSDPDDPPKSEASVLNLPFLMPVGAELIAYLTGGGSGQPMQIAASRDGNTPFISPELDPSPQVFARTTMTRSSSG